MYWIIFQTWNPSEILDNLRSKISVQKDVNEEIDTRVKDAKRRDHCACTVERETSICMLYCYSDRLYYKIFIGR